MSKSDFPGKSSGSKTADLQYSTSETTLRAAQGEAPRAPDIKKQVVDAYDRAARRIGQAARHDEPRATSVYDKARDLAQLGFVAAGQQLASSPLASIASATLIGVALGWAFRGAREEQRRRHIAATCGVGSRAWWC